MLRELTNAPAKVQFQGPFHTGGIIQGCKFYKDRNGRHVKH